MEAANGYPNVLMPGGFYNNRVHTKKVDPIVQDNVSWELKNHFLQFGFYGEQGTYNGIADRGCLSSGRVHFQSRQTRTSNIRSTNQAPYNGCVNPNPAGNLRSFGRRLSGKLL